MSSSSGTVSGLFDSKSAEFKDFLVNSLIVLGVGILLGLVWNFFLKVYLLRRNRVRPTKSKTEMLQGEIVMFQLSLLF